jgi:hypothetical protein
VGSLVRDQAVGPEGGDPGRVSARAPSGRNAGDAAWFAENPRKLALRNPV